MSHSWVMVWIPTKTLEKKKTPGIDISISQGHIIERSRPYVAVEGHRQKWRS